MAIYYVSVADGNDTYDGTEQTHTTGNTGPWQTIAKVNAASFSGGDQILFKKSEVWREQLTVPSSGTDGHPITFGAYGSGADPIINGSDIITGWTNSGTPPALSDDFETNNFSKWTSNSGASSVSATAKKNGSYGYLINGASGRANKALSANATYAVRGYFQVAAETMGDGNQTQIVWLGYNTGSNGIARIWIKQASGQLYVDATSMSDFSPANTFAISTGVWYKFDLRVKVSATVGYCELWIDDDRKVNDTGLNTGTTNMDYAWIGVEGWNDGTLTNYYDDIDIYDPAAPPGNVWQATLTTAPSQLYFDGTRGTKQASSGACDSANDWYWAANVLYVYSASDPDAAYVAPGIEAPIRPTNILLNGKDYVTLQNIQSVYTNEDDDGGVKIFNSDYTVLDNVTVHDCGGWWGVWLIGDSTYATIQNCTIYNQTATDDDRGSGISDDTDATNGYNTISNCTIYDNHGRGIEGNVYGTGLRNLTVSDCTIYSNGSSGVGLAGGTGLFPNNCIIENNKFYDNCVLTADRYQVDLFQVGDGNIVRYNVIYDGNYISTDGGGIRHDNAPTDNWGTNNQIYYNVIYDNYRGVHLLGGQGSKVYNNTIYNSTHTGILVQGATATGNLVKNNIVHTAGTYLVQDTDGSSNTIDYNLYYDATLTNKFHHDATDYSTLADWRTASGQDANSPAIADPLFTNAAGDDFTLQVGSPCINAGVDVGLTADYAGNPISGNPDIGAYELQGTIATHILRYRVA